MLLGVVIVVGIIVVSSTTKLVVVEMILSNIGGNRAPRSAGIKRKETVNVHLKTTLLENRPSGTS